MQHYHVLKKLNLDPYHRVVGGVRGLLAKYLLVCCCIYDSLKFDMQHDHFLKMQKFDLLTPPPGSGGGKLEGCLSTKNMLPCCCFYNSFKLDMQHDHVVEKLEF